MSIWPAHCQLSRRYRCVDDRTEPFFIARPNAQTFAKVLVRMVRECLCARRRKLDM
jgi:hypothetical protein